MNKEQIAMIVAQAYCTEENKKKIVDTDLMKALVEILYPAIQEDKFTMQIVLEEPTHWHSWNEDMRIGYLQCMDDVTDFLKKRALRIGAEINIIGSNEKIKNDTLSDNVQN